MANREKRVLITPEEALSLLRFSTISSIYRAKDLRKAYEVNQEKHTEGSRWDTMCLLAFIYDVGRIQGIREERERRKH